MKETLINGQRAVVAHHQSAEVPKPSEGAFHNPPTFVAAQRPTVLRRGFASVLPVRGDQFDPPGRQLPAQRIAIVSTVGNQTARPLPGTAASCRRPTRIVSIVASTSLTSDGEAA